MPEAFTTNSDATFDNFIAHARKLYEEKKYVTWSWRIGPDRSMDQNALFHVWSLEYGCFVGKLNPKCLNALERERVIEGTKRGVKCAFYRETASPWMVHEITDLFTGVKKKDFRSSAGYTRGEMFTLLTWMQARAANDGLLLESKGEYAKLKREQNQ